LESITPTQDDQFLQCMEVWGGNQSADRSVAMAGLDAWVYSKPFGGSDEGGDIYYVSSCATGRILRLLIADVAGHGQAVRHLATQLQGLMRQHVNQIDQIRFVQSMNNQFSHLARDGCFATAVVSTFFPPTGRLMLCNAGHPLPLIYRSARQEWSFLQSTGRTVSLEPVNLPLGILDLADYQTFDVTLDVGDLVLCYTDSLTESRRPDGELLEHEGLLRIVQALDVHDPATFIPALLSAIAATAPGNLTGDDVTVLLFRPNGSGARQTLRNRAVGMGRLVLSIARSLRPGAEPAAWPDFKLPNVGGAIFPPLQRLWNSRRRGRKPN
jgi:hypothetical protein